MRLSRWRSQYWSCTRFANWVRGTRKLRSGTAEQWDDWHRQAKRAHPFRFWLAEEALDHIQNFLWFPVDVWETVRGYLLNRFVYEYHLLRADREFIKPGDYCDFGDRILPCVFSSFARWVEHVGLDHFEWAKDLTYDADYGFDETHPDWGKPTPQALKAREVILLHWWWRVVRPARAETEEVSMEFWTQMNDKYGNDCVALAMSSKFTSEERQTWLDLHAEGDRIQAEYDAEDTAMLRRLIDLRRELWT